MPRLVGRGGKFNGKKNIVCQVIVVAFAVLAVENNAQNFVQQNQHTDGTGAKTGKGTGLKRQQRSQQLCYTNFYQKIKQRQTSEKQYDVAFGTLSPPSPLCPLLSLFLLAGHLPSLPEITLNIYSWSAIFASISIYISSSGSGSGSARFLLESVLCCASLTYQ